MEKPRARIILSSEDKRLIELEKAKEQKVLG
jgi:hypothetical protein